LTAFDKRCRLFEVKELRQSEVDDNPCWIHAHEEPISKRGLAVFFDSSEAIRNPLEIFKRISDRMSGGSGWQNPLNNEFSRSAG